ASGYFILRLIILNETKETLLEKEYLIINQITETGNIPNIYPVIEINKTDSPGTEKPCFNEIYIMNKQENEMEAYLEYSNHVRINGFDYSVRLRQSYFESEDFVIVLALSLFILLLSAFGMSFFISKRINKTVWAGFEHNLQEIENFSLHENTKLLLLNSDIEEFDRLNTVLNKLTEKLKADYFSLKEFTENASHEIQTPLSIVLLNLEEVLQQELNAETFQKVVSAINAIKRLSTLNQGLVLLTKIENRQFIADKTLILNDIIREKLLEFSGLFETKNLNVELQADNNFILKMNEQLAELLINNLLSNAVYHNVTDGFIRISITEKEFSICNTGDTNTLTDKTIFNRFSKGNSRSNGLGLAIVKNICDTHDLEIHYENNELHCFTINPKY
ncbi:MAG: HAMP domain-containing sensor histidine kinase, partial [Bacteroidota bacterium]